MRIAYLVLDPGVPVFGTKGASVHVQEIVRAFRARGDEVTIYCTRRGGDAPADLADVRVVERRLPKGETAARERAVALTSGELAELAVADGAELVYERYSLFSTAGAMVRGALGIPFVLEVNAPLVDEQRTHRELVDLAGAVGATRRALATASVVACVSQPVAAWVVSTEPRAATSVVVAPNGVDTRRFRPTPRRGRRVCTVVFVGTLKPWHGVEVLLRAMAPATRDASGPAHPEPPAAPHARLDARAAADAAHASTRPDGGARLDASAAPDATGVTTRVHVTTRADEPAWRLVVAGDGPEGPALRALAGRLGGDVTFTGAVDPAGVPALLADADVAVAPYPADAADHYFSPLKVTEYLAAGLPVVASEIGQLPDLLEHGRAGLLVPAGDADALRAALVELAADPVRRAMLGIAAREVAERHDWCGVLDRVLEHRAGAISGPRRDANADRRPGDRNRPADALEVSA